MFFINDSIHVQSFGSNTVSQSLDEEVLNLLRVRSYETRLLALGSYTN